MDFEDITGYIKKFIENDLEHNWETKYVPLDDAKVSILFGRPHNQRNSEQGHEFSKLFGWDEKNKTYYFWNKDNKKCFFVHKYIPDQKKGINHKLCIVVNFKDYDNAKDAKQAMDDVANKINYCLTTDIEIIDCCLEYRAVLVGCFADEIDPSIRFDEDWNSLYVKHDDNGQYEAFKSILFDRIVPNTLILDNFEEQREVDIFRRLLIERVDDNLRYAQSVSYDHHRHGLVIYDERIQNKEFRNHLHKMIDGIRQNEIQSIYIGKQYFPMILGPDGCHLNEILKHCSLDCMDRSLMQLNRENGMVLFGGLRATDDRLEKFKNLTHRVIDSCEMIELSAKEWRYLAQNKSWNVIMLQKDSGKCCLSLQYLTADKVLFYGPRSAKRQIINKIAEAAKWM